MLLRIISTVMLTLVLGTGSISAQEKAGSSGVGLVARAFKLPSDMFTQSDLSNPVGAPKGKMGVKLLPDKLTAFAENRRYDVREYLKELGVEIPAEGEATFFEGAGVLVVRASEEKTDHIEALLGPGNPCYWPQPLIQVSFSIVQFTLNKPIEDSDSLAYANLRSVAGTSWKIIDRQIVRTRSGVLTRHASGNTNGQPAFISVQVSGEAAGKTDKLVPRNFEEDEAGTRLEMEPVLGPDGRTVEMPLVYRHRSKAKADAVIYEYDITTSVSAWDGYPLVVQLVEDDTPEREDEPRRYRALILKTELVNFGGWNRRDQEEPGSAQ